MAVALQEATVQITRHRFTADEYQRMAEVGIFPPNARVELVQGEVIEMPPIGANHVACIGRTTRSVMRQVDERVMVLVQCSIRIASDGEPQPDFLVVRSDYDDQHLPTPADTLVIIEVSDSSLLFDCSVKVRLYGSAGIPEYWIFDLAHSRIERHTNPYSGGYSFVAIVGPGERLASTTLPTLETDVNEVLGLAKAELPARN